MKAETLDDLSTLEDLIEAIGWAENTADCRYQHPIAETYLEKLDEKSLDVYVQLYARMRELPKAKPRRGMLSRVEFQKSLYILNRACLLSKSSIHGENQARRIEQLLSYAGRRCRHLLSSLPVCLRDYQLLANKYH